MADANVAHDEQKAFKRRKQLKRMSKIVAKAWALANSEPFQETHHRSSSNTKAAFDLTTIGEHIDKEEYGPGRQGWEHFAKDIGGVYNRHIVRKTKHARIAKEHVAEVTEMLMKLDSTLGKLASEYCPTTGSDKQKAKKRKSVDATENTNKKQKVPEKRIADSKKKSAAPRKKPDGKKEKEMTTRECETEIRKVRRELDKLLKAHRKATKTLDDFQNERKESQYPVDDEVLMEEEAENNVTATVTRTACPAALVPDIDGFPGIPAHCVPDMVMVWDFLCTFGRALSLVPISLDNFAAALTFKPATATGDLPPVYLAEAHLGLLKILLNDQSSDDWWWSTLETPDVEAAAGDFGDVSTAMQKGDSNVPVIKVDMAALLADAEDPLLTASWIQALEGVRNQRANASRQIRLAVKSALSIVTNRYVKAYLKISIRNRKGNAVGFAKRAVVWLVDRIKDARPDLWGENISQQLLFQQKAKVAEESFLAMEKLDEALEAVNIDDVTGDSDDDDSDDSDEEEEDDEEDQLRRKSATMNGSADIQDDSLVPSKSPIPVKPPPAIVDLLLPPAKPLASSGIVNSFTWPYVAGAATCRILHWYKRLRNEVDDRVREFRELPPMSIAERRQRESVAAARVFSECVANDGEGNPLQRGIVHLCSGGAYLGLSVVERLCIFKVLIEASYDASRTYAVVDENFKSRINALKSLEAEERRAKREAREEASAEATAAREQLTFESKTKFLFVKRNEITEQNIETNEYTSEFMENLTDEDIAEFDEETKNEFDALPGPENFNKTEVNKMVKQLQEAAAFDTHSLAVLTMDEILSREKTSLESLEERIAELGNIDDLLRSQSIDRETSKSIQKLCKDIEDAKYYETSLPSVREPALETLKDAMEDGTIKVLRGAIRLAKQVKLTGYDEETDGLWALDLLRDVHLELKAAEKHKRVIDAQKDLVAKRNKCFIRTEPLGRDRFHNRFWHFDADENARVWVEADYIAKDSSSGGDFCSPGQDYVNLLADTHSLSVGEADREEDLKRNDDNGNAIFSQFCRQEFHSAGSIASLAKRHWGCQTTEKSLRALIKNLDKRGIREDELRSNLKITLEDSGLAASAESQKQVQTTGDEEGGNSEEKVANNVNENDDVADEHQVKGDEVFFDRAKTGKMSSSTVTDLHLLQEMATAIGKRVRVREVIDPTKIPAIANYIVATVTGWKMQREEEEQNRDDDGNVEHLNSTRLDGNEGRLSAPVLVPVWRAIKDGGEEVTLSSNDLIESLCRFIRWRNQIAGYVEDDAAVFAYRNSVGRHSGRAADAALSASPMFFARLMVKREQEIYAPLKNRTYDNSWGGKSGARNVWTTTMKDYAYDLDTARNGLLTLENAFLELTGGFADDETTGAEVGALIGKSLLNDESSRFDIELESIGKEVQGLWNSRKSRSVFLEIVESSSTTGVLALALDLLCRNCWVFVNANKLSQSTRGSRVAPPEPVNSRRLNAWQQANQNSLYSY